MKAQIKKEDSSYLATMIEDLFSIRISRQVKFIIGDIHTTVEYEGINRVEKFIIQECANLNKAETPQTRGEEMLEELEQINEDMEAKNLKLKIEFEVKQVLQKVLRLTQEPNVSLTYIRQEVKRMIDKPEINFCNTMQQKT